MAEELTEYMKIVNDDVLARAHALDMLREHAFVEQVSEVLVEYGAVDALESCHFHARGMKIDAFEFEDDNSTLTLVVSHWFDHATPQDATLSKDQSQHIFEQAKLFLQKSLAGGLEDSIELANPAHDLAALIWEYRSTLTAARLILATDGIVEDENGTTERLGDLTIETTIWDARKAHEFSKTGVRDQIKIDFANEHGGILPCIKYSSSKGAYAAYLAFIPGDVLADLYGTWKTRLLERNVRVFLSDAVRVNQGIQATIRQEPEMFCAYNNGITVYAQAVETVDLGKGSRGIVRVADFQIVNGGQTTASLYYARKKTQAPLDGIAVQMKLMVINEEVSSSQSTPSLARTEIILPKIGRFSNTQNSIQLADLMANDPPHPEIEAISLNTAAPDPTGGSHQTFWFYERSRGKYGEVRRLRATTDQKERVFDSKYPKTQRFDKPKFGKVWNTYRRQPHVVSLGGMKNFAHFNSWLQLAQEDWLSFFRKTVALLILWNAGETIVQDQKYGGYRSQIVTYTLAWLYYLTDLRIDLERIWTDQRIDPALSAAIKVLAPPVNQHLRGTELNITEWCKKADCWERLKASEAPALQDLSPLLTSSKPVDLAIQSRPSEEEEVTFCREKGAEAWFALSKWLKEHDFMQGKQRSQCFNMARAIADPQKEPSAVLSHACRRIWEQAVEGYGWQPDTRDG
jgi:hypothetical protein